MIRIVITNTAPLDALQMKVLRNDVCAMFRRFPVAGRGMGSPPLPKDELTKLSRHLVPWYADGVRLLNLVPRRLQKLVGLAAGRASRLEIFRTAW